MIFFLKIYLKNTILYNMADNYDIIVVLNDIKKLLEKQNELLEKQQTNQQAQTKITVVGNKAQTAIPKGINSKDDFTL